MGFSYIHKNVEECLSKCCIISFETVVENYLSVKTNLTISFWIPRWVRGWFFKVWIGYNAWLFEKT